MNRIRRFVFVAIVCGCVLFFQWAYAQQTKPSKQKESSPPPSEQTEPSTTPIEKELSFLLGKWETKVKITPTDLSAIKEEVKGGGTAEYRVFGKTIEGIIKSESNIGSYEAREFIFYNPSEKAYEVFAINANGVSSNRKLSKVGDHFEVTYKGKRPLRDESGKPGKEVEFRVRGEYKIVSDKEVQYFAEIEFGKGTFKPFITLVMTRVP